MAPLSGSCICGSVRYEAYGEFRDIVACHCVECRKASGHFTAATSVKPENLKLLNKTGLAWYRTSPSAERAFCRECGCTLFWKPDSGDRISLFVGAIDGRVDLPFTSHIYLSEKGSYYEITDEADQHMAAGAKLTLE